MIRVLMLGRTGNNLFQYAFGRVLAERHRVPLVLDGSWFNVAGWRGVSCLSRLPIRAEVSRRHSWPKRLLRKLVGRHPEEFRGRQVIHECPTDHRFVAAHLEEGTADCFVRGYFQSPLYFRGFEARLREELAMEGLPWSRETLDLARAMEKPGAVAVHVRRTDYVGNPDVAVCDEGYFASAMTYLRERHEGLRFHVFSDDPVWCAREFKGDDIGVCALPAGACDPLHDLFLMSRASHHVICNSTYSWWAAWLGKKPDQQVILPNRWFASGIHAPIEEKLCEGWITLPAA